MIDYRVPIEIGQVRINPGDILFGDIDGVCCVPRDAEQDVFRLAIEKARGEKKVADTIRGGMSTVEAWNRFGIM